MQMKQKIRILFLSANPWTTSRILVDEEAREIFERIQEGPYRNHFELHKHVAIRPIDLQKLLLMHRPHIVHFSGHGSKKQKIIMGGTPGRGKTVDRQGLVELLALYSTHVRVVLLNACFTNVQARSIAEVIDYSVGTGKGIGDKAGVAFAGAFYRALGFGKSIRQAFESARAELALTRMPRTQGIELFVREGLRQDDPFPRMDIVEETCCSAAHATTVLKRIEERSECRITIFETANISRSRKRLRAEIRSMSVRRHDAFERRIMPDLINPVK
jgi:hypothetical protein